MSRARQPGITTDEIDKMVHAKIVSYNAYPSPLNFRQFPKSICASVNDVACHGIPDQRPLQEGDLVKIDVSIFVDGFHGDCCGTFAVGQIDSTAQKLMDVTKFALDAAIQASRAGGLVADIGHVIGYDRELCLLSRFLLSEMDRVLIAFRPIARANGFSVVRDYNGHGVGRFLHQYPIIPHYEVSVVATSPSIQLVLLPVSAW